ncbi:MAG TPA: hypothetical protein VLG76_07555 [Rhabdochlamydiaceae bacterium]|nr:hypothetical protein [Rhabdochlamydiaceae bacterium]
MSDINRVVNAVVVGAGPVGLWAAIQTKLRNPESEIDVLEKNPVYQRGHVLKLNAKSLADCPKDPRLQAIVAEFIQNKHIRTNDIEQRLLGFAEEIGIRVRKNVEVVNPENLLRLYPQAKVIIGADGAHSVIREKIFGNEMYAQGDQKYVIEVKYEVYGKGARLNLIKQQYPTWKIMDGFAQEHVGTEKDGKTPITLRIFIDKEKYEQMQDANFKHPYTFENENKIHHRVRERIWTWLNFKAGIAHEQRVPGSEKITTTRLGYYASKHVVKRVNNVAFCLVGDAALGVPFFRSLNNGFLEGTKLSKALAAILAPKRSLVERLVSQITLRTHGMPWPLLRYSNYVRSLARTEIIIAAIKSFFLSLLILFIRISARVPWQVNYWTEAQIDQLPT